MNIEKVRRTAYKQQQETNQPLHPHDYRFLKRGFISFVCVVACTLVGATYSASNNQYEKFETQQLDLMGHIPIHAEVVDMELPPPSIQEMEEDLDF